jgi:hypothetical protein
MMTEEQERNVMIYYLLLVIVVGVLSVIVLAEPARAQSDTQSSGGGWWDVVVGWWQGFSEWVGLSSPENTTMPVGYPPVVGWSNTNHTDYNTPTNLSRVNDSCTPEEQEMYSPACYHWVPNQYATVIDDRWQTVTNGLLNINLSRDKYWFQYDSLIVGSDNKNCDGALHIDAIKTACQYVVYNITANDTSVRDVDVALLKNTQIGVVPV